MLFPLYKLNIENLIFKLNLWVQMRVANKFCCFCSSKRNMREKGKERYMFITITTFCLVFYLYTYP